MFLAQPNATFSIRPLVAATVAFGMVFLLHFFMILDFRAPTHQYDDTQVSVLHSTLIASTPLAKHSILQVLAKLGWGGEK